jgi:hypothetical protein
VEKLQIHKTLLIKPMWTKPWRRIPGDKNTGQQNSGGQNPGGQNPCLKYYIVLQTIIIFPGGSGKFSGLKHIKQQQKGVVFFCVQKRRRGLKMNIFYCTNSSCQIWFQNFLLVKQNNFTPAYPMNWQN